MIPLFRKLFPSHKADLVEALDEALHRFVEKPGPIVDLRSRALDAIRADEPAVVFDQFLRIGRAAAKARSVRSSGIGRAVAPVVLADPTAR